jgi:hypothetical protein
MATNIYNILPAGCFEAALAEALHIVNLERNGDVVCMASYAPLLAKG